jgi:hypothetical protein
MTDAPVYTTVPGKITTLLAKIRETGVPSKATTSWLKTLGLKSSNDPSLLPVLKQIGFVDASSVPTPAWKQYRGSDHKAVLGRAIQVGYADLYQTYPDAHNRSNTDIGHVFTTQSNAGKQAIDKMVSTFKNLATLAEFSDTPVADMDDSTISARPVPTVNGISAPVVAVQAPATKGLAVNINIALTLPETSDEKVFAAFFKAMREHLLTDPNA